MARRGKIVLLTDRVSASDHLADTLRGASFDVDVFPRAAVAGAVSEADAPDLLLVDAAGRADVAAVISGLRERWPEVLTPLLVMGVGDTATAAAAIDAGATDAVSDAEGGPVLNAHIRRLIRIAGVLRTRFDQECRRANSESIAKAAAAVAVPLGALIDTLEAAMSASPLSDRLDEMLELTSDAVDAVDRLRQLSDKSGHA